VHRPPDLRARLSELALLEPKERWQPFERLITTLFKRGYFKTERASRAAGRRQLDLVASRRGGVVYMVEAKWKKRPLAVGDLDGLYARLDGTAPSTVGVLISPSGFQRGVVTEIIEKKQRPVLLLGPEELVAALDDPRSLARTLQRKHDHFMTTGEVLVGSNDADINDPASSTWGLRQPQLVDGNGLPLRWIRSDGGFGEFVFSQELTDIDWVPAGGRGVSLDLQPALHSETDLIELVDELVQGGWLSVGATWTIEQFNASWHGLGWSTFVESIGSSNQRYQEVDHVHHREEYCLTDSLDGQLLVLSGDISARRERVCFHSNLCFHLQGVPLDVEPFTHLAEVLGDEGFLHWRPTAERSLASAGFRGEHLLLEPVAYVVEEDPDDEREPVWVRGLVVANPFGGERPDHVGEWGWPAGLTETALVLCSLGQWHPWRDVPEAYELRNVEWAHTTDFAVVRVVADWRGELRRPDGSVRASR
jgi:Restriction endonuclease